MLFHGCARMIHEYKNEDARLRLLLLSGKRREMKALAGITRRFTQALPRLILDSLQQRSLLPAKSIFDNRFLWRAAGAQPFLYNLSHDFVVGYPIVAPPALRALARRRPFPIQIPTRDFQKQTSKVHFSTSSKSRTLPPAAFHNHAPAIAWIY